MIAVHTNIQQLKLRSETFYTLCIHSFSGGLSYQSHAVNGKVGGRHSTHLTGPPNELIICIDVDTQFLAEQLADACPCQSHAHIDPCLNYKMNQVLIYCLYNLIYQEGLQCGFLAHTHFTWEIFRESPFFELRKDQGLFLYGCLFWVLSDPLLGQSLATNRKNSSASPKTRSCTS